MPKYRIVKFDFPPGNYNFEVQTNYWRQVSRRARFKTLEEAKDRIEQLKRIVDRKQRIVFEE